MMAGPKPCVPLDPYGSVYFAWLSLISTSVLYNWYSIPLRMAFEQVQDNKVTWLVLDYVCDMIYWMDIGVNLILSVPRLGLPQQDLKYSRQTYMKSATFILDIIRFRWHRITEWMERVISHSNFPIVFRFGRILFYILCAYYALNVHIGFGFDGWTIKDYGNTTEGQFVHLYIRSFHWATIILSDDGDNKDASLVVELIFRCFFTIKGHILVGTVIAIVANIFATVNVKESRFRHQLDGIKKYMVFRHVDQDMQDRVLKWASFVWEEKKFLDTERDLLILPVPLRRNIAKVAHMDTFQRVKLFNDCEPQFLEELIMRLELQVFSPGDLVCRKGDVGHEMYIVRSGTLHVVSEEGVVFASMGQGSVFGEISLLSIFTRHENRRTANVQSFSYSDLFSLSAGDFKEVLESFPLARKKMIEKSRELLKDRTLSEVIHTDADECDELAFKVEKLQDLSQDISLLIESFTKTIINDTAKLKERLAALEELNRRPHPTRKPKLILAHTAV